MATGGLYGSSLSGTLIAQPGTDSVGLYGNSIPYGGTYFEWFIFQQSATAPATPTGGSWNFTTNVGTPPTGWTVLPPTNPTKATIIINGPGVVSPRAKPSIICVALSQ